MMPDIPGSMNTPMHAQHLVSHINPMNAPPQVYTNPIISMPPLPFQIYTTHPTNLAYPNAPTTHKLSSPSSRSTTRHHPYQRKGQASATREKSQIGDIYPSPLSELSKIIGLKRMAVSELFTNPSKKLATSSSFQDRMMFAAHSLSALKNSPPAPNTPILQKVSSAKDLVPFSVTQSSYAESSPTTKVDTMGLQTALMSPTSARKVSTLVVGEDSAYDD
jgi:hypothetical protein